MFFNPISAIRAEPDSILDMLQEVSQIQLNDCQLAIAKGSIADRSQAALGVQVVARWAIASASFCALALRSLWRSVRSSILSRSSRVNRNSSSITSTTRSR